jgi:cold shock CspA family protein
MIGELVRYDRRRNHGFIEGDGARVFVHSSELRRASVRRPINGMTLKFESGLRDGREVAIKILELKS